MQFFDAFSNCGKFRFFVIIPIRFDVCLQRNRTGNHLLRQPIRIVGNHAIRHIHNARCAAEILLQMYLMHMGISLCEGNHVVRVAASKLIDCLVIVAHDANIRTCLRNPKNQLFLKIVDILILIYNQILNLRKTRLDLRIAFHLAQRLKNHQREVNVLVRIKTLDVFV